jgi:hypothetical protein
MAEAAKDATSRDSATAKDERQGGHVCTVGFCPICLAVTTVQPLRPEAVEHLLNAAREFLLAMSAVLSARADDTGGKESAPTLTRIDIE